MARDISTAARNALADASPRLLAFVELDFYTGWVRTCTAAHDVAWNGLTWTGSGLLIKAGELRESAEIEAIGYAFELSGVPSTVLATAINEQYQGRKVRMWAAPLDANYQFTDVRLVYVGRMDTMTVLDGDTATIRLDTESRLADLKRARTARMNGADQQSRYPGDTGLDRIDALSTDREIKWGTT